MNSQTKLRMGNSLLKSSVMAAVLGLSGVAAFAAATASDTAVNYAPSSWNTTPANLGSGFGAWVATLNNANNPPYVGTYLDTGSAVATSGYSWGTYANGGDGSGSFSIARPFTAGISGSSSLFNQTFSFDLTSAGIGPGQGVLSAQIGDAFLFQYLGSGADNFTLNGNATTIGFSALNAGIHVSLAVSGTLNSATEGYTFTVSPFSGGSPLFTTSGTFDSSTLNTASFKYLDSNTTGNGYFNNLTITPEAVPEPATLTLAGLGGLAALLAIRRRK